LAKMVDISLKLTMQKTNIMVTKALKVFSYIILGLAGMAIMAVILEPEPGDWMVLVGAALYTTQAVLALLYIKQSEEREKERKAERSAKVSNKG